MKPAAFGLIVLIPLLLPLYVDQGQQPFSLSVNVDLVVLNRV